MIKAVFFDWFNTLAVYYPPREELQSQAIQEFGFTVSPDTVRPALMKADEIIFAENNISPMRLKSPEQQAEIYIRYEEKLLSEAGIDTSGQPGLAARVIKRARELYGNISFQLFDDVQPVLKSCKERNLLTGLITNLEEDLKSICTKLGIAPYIDIIVTSGEAGSDKPQPEIFMLALRKAGVEPAEAVHVGDQYKSDGLGAAGVGIKPVIIDRFDLYPEITDYPRIRTLDEIFAYL